MFVFGKPFQPSVIKLSNSLETFVSFVKRNSGGLYYKPIMIVNDDSKVVNKLETSHTDDGSVVIYDRHMFIVQATDLLSNSKLVGIDFQRINALAYWSSASMKK